MIGTKKESYYFVMIINLIAKKYNMLIYESYKYLNQYKGIEFLQEFYDVEMLVYLYYQASGSIFPFVKKYDKMCFIA